jgi:hypothetical protein
VPALEPDATLRSRHGPPAPRQDTVGPAQAAGAEAHGGEVPAPRPTSAAHGRPAIPGPVGATLGLPAGAVATIVAWAFGGAPGTGIVLAAVAAAALAAATSAPGALGAAAQCWACADGFVLNRFGTLGDGHADLVALVAVLTAATAAHVLAVLVRRVRVLIR